jgi:Bacterial dnaA protein helix-turn-helix
MNFHSALVEHYAAVRVRLRAPLLDLDFIEAPKALLIEYQPEPHDVVDVVPDQRGRLIMPIDRSAEKVAARRALAGFARRRQANPTQNTVRQLQASVAEAFKVDVEDMLARSMRPGPSRIRQIAMTLAKRVCKQSRAEIGRRFDRNHSTCMHAEKKFAWLLDAATSQIGGA